MAIDVRTRSSRLYWTLPLGLLVALVSLIPRLDGEYSSGRYLWAEDGNVFINQAQSLGLRSIWTPYRGYVHAYPRLVALIGRCFELKNQPHVFLGGWIFAFGVMTAILVVRASNLGLGSLHVCALVTLVSLQPNCEVFFNITNAQSILGTAAITYILASVNRRTSLLECILLAVLCLTGPFSIWIAPLVIIHGLWHRALKQNSGLYLVVLVCAAIQAGLLLNSSRFTQTVALDRNLGSWLAAFWSIILFGARRPAALLAAYVFWAAVVLALACPSKGRPPNATTRKGVSWLILGAAVANIVAALYSLRAHPMGVLALECGHRYMWIPCSLFIFGSAIATVGFAKTRYLAMAALAVICQERCRPIMQPNLRFESYANLSNYRSVLIPINPQVSSQAWRPGRPGWYVDGGNPGRNADSVALGYKMERDAITGSGVTLEWLGDTLDVLSKTDNPVLIFGRPIICPGASDIGVEIEMVRSHDGWMQMFWDPWKNFTESNSIRRTYPAGRIRAQFAFPNGPGGVYVRFDPLEQRGEAKIEGMLVYCLP